jgi:Kelch motif
MKVGDREDADLNLKLRRFNHSTVSYNGKLYIFGGESYARMTKYLKETYNDLQILDCSKYIIHA